MITIMYTCHGCGLVKVNLQVRRRTYEQLDYWIRRRVAVAIAQDHRQRSPHCRESKADIYIPAPPDGHGVGQADVRRDTQ